MPLSTLARLPQRHIAAVLLEFAACVMLAWWLLQMIGANALRGGAEQMARGHAQFMHETTPGLERLLETGVLDEPTREQLAHMRHLGEVFRFKLFDREGRPLLASDHLDAADPLAASRASWPGRDADERAYAAPAETMTGQNRIEVRHGPGQADRPAVYVEAYIPLLRHGRVIGVAEIYLDHSARFARMRVALLQALAVVAALAAGLGAAIWWYFKRHRIERRRTDERLRFLSEHDRLTGALNRDCFVETVAKAVATRAPGAGLAVLCIDLDRFKDINDALGHAAGDAALRQAAERLRTLLQAGDRLARLGADEFAVLLTSEVGVDGAARFARRVVDALAEPFDLEGRRAASGASVGVACIGDGEAGQLLHQADVAMVRAKRAGGARFSFYHPDSERQIGERRRLTDDLRTALATGALSLHYQPLWANDGVTLLGYEALMRWLHPERGMVPPNVFIPLAEESGQIEALGAWALASACAQAGRWPGQLSVSVNLSPAQFHGQRPLAGLVEEALATSSLAPERLVLEITESLLMSNTDAVVQTLDAIARMRVHVAMDDFGTGYSSLGSLWRFPFDKVKIDRVFVKDLAQDNRVALVVRSIVALAHSLGMRVTAEGVETAAQADLLRRLGCDELQGFLLGRPMPASALNHRGAAVAAPESPTPPDWDDLLTMPAVL